MPKNIYYFKLNDDVILDLTGIYLDTYSGDSLADFLGAIDNMPALEYLPFSTNDEIIEALWEGIIAEYLDEYAFKIVKPFNEPYTIEEVNAALKQWACKLLALIGKTQDYYKTLLGFYATEKANLMDDIKATSKNKVKFNDTPQNPNNLDVYEGDNYITHFTATEGENSSPLTSKMMRLKEIQDNYHDILSDWIKKFHSLFIEEANL